MSTDGMRMDWANKDFYAELGVTKQATQAEIKKSYRKLARANHPDSNPGDTAKHEKFKAVAEAYDVVGDEDKRKKYDEMRELYGSGGFGGGAPGGAGGFDLNDLLRERTAVAASVTSSATSSGPAAAVSRRARVRSGGSTSRPTPRSASRTPWTASRSASG